MTMVAVVTGASRGAGKGIAVALGRTGATVYVTGRSRKPLQYPPQNRILWVLINRGLCIRFLRPTPLLPTVLA